MTNNGARRITAPTVEPVTVPECKLDAHVDGSTEDMLFVSWIAAARVLVEDTARRSMIHQTFELPLDAWPVHDTIMLPYPPLVSITSITYYDPDNAVQTLSSASYIVVADEEPGIVVLADDASWPDVHSLARIRVRYVAGYGATAASVPEGYKANIRGLVKLFYDFRSAWPPDAERAMGNILSNAGMNYGW